MIDFPWFMVGFDFNQTSCVLFIPKPWQGYRKHNKLDKNHIHNKTTDILLSHNSIFNLYIPIQ